MKFLYHFFSILFALTAFTLNANAQPPNSSCASAIPISVGAGSCSSTLYTNVGAPSVGLPSVPACWIPATSSNTVWFSLVATSTDIEISTNFGGTLANTQIAVYSGTCGALTQIACQEDINTAGGLYQTDVIIHGLTVNNTYYMAVDGNGNSTGTFGICAQQSLPVAPAGPTQDCETAQFLCTAAQISVADGPGGTGVVQTNPSCFGAPGERSSIWYNFTPSSSGNLNFTVTPNTIIDYDFALYNISSGCPGTEIACNWSGATFPNGTTGAGCTGLQCVAPIPLVAGQTYSLLIDRYTASSASGFTLDFTGTTATFGGPPAGFTATSACIGSPTTFTNTTAGVNTYSWNFGDTYTSTAQNPTHTYAAAGTYNASLLVTTNPGGCQNTITHTVTVNAMPTVTASTNSPVCSGANAVFTLTGTASSTITYNINGGAVQTAILNTGGTATVTVTGVTGTTTINITHLTEVTGCNVAVLQSYIVTVGLPAAPTVTTPVVYCKGATATALTATGTNLLWYATASGGTGSATAPTPSTSTAGSTIYYVSQTPGTCESPRAAITVNVTALPAAPSITTPVNYCKSATATALTATGANLLWYTTASGGTGSITAPTPSTATAGSTIFYVSQTPTTCESPRAAITVTINALPAAPTVTSPITYCQNATIVQLSAGGTNLLWYTNASGGTGSATAPTPTTTTAGSTIFYVSQTTGSCESPRAAITLTVNATPSAPTVISPITYCQNATATQLSAGGTNLLWYTTASGGTGSATAPTPSTSTAGPTIFYVSQTPTTCESPRASITVTVNATPSAPTVISPITYCQNATATQLSAGGTNLLWYATASDGTGSATAPTPSTSTAGSIIYYVSQTTGSCESPRAAITVNVTALPAAPGITTPISYCKGATATALTATGTNLLWYTTASGGTGSATAPTPSTATAGSIIYYVSQTVGSCESPRASITVTVNATPAAPTVSSPISYCQNATAAQLSAGGTNLLWYTTSTGGTGSATAPTPSTATASSTIFYVSQTAGSCESSRAAITVTVNATPSAPTVSSPITYCQNATAVQLSAGGTNLLWYTTASGGTGSATVPTPTTATAGSTIFYVSQTPTTCESPRAAITVTVNATPAAPTVSSLITYCQNATATQLSAGGTNLLWYTNATGGTGSSTAPTPSTATAGSTIYYVTQTPATCESPRAGITVNVTALPTAPGIMTPVSYCKGATATALTATGTNLLWYTNATGGTGSVTAPTPSTATAGAIIYYVSQTTGTCEGPRAAITVTVNASPAAPTVSSPIAYCQNATAAQLSAGGTNLLWYTTSTGGTGSATAPTPSTATASSTIFYVSQTMGTCESPRAAITVTVNATPAAPTVSSPIAYCQNVTAAQLSAGGTNLLWYMMAIGGTGSATAPTPITTTAGSTIFYVSQTLGTCESPRAAITVTVNATPSAPTVSSTITYCQNATAAQLSAGGTNLLWYTTSTGGTGSATAPTPITTTAGSTIFYVSQTPITCESPRTAITVTINALPAAPAVSSPIIYCQNATAVQLSAGGTNLLWYTSASGGTGSATAPIPTTTTAGSTIYYVSQTVGSCESPRAAITVTVNEMPPAPTVSSPITYCQNATAAQLSADGANLLWYTTSTGGTGSATAPTPSTATAGSTIFYVSQTTGSCESPRASITVTVNGTPSAPTVTSPITYCQNATAVQLSAGGTNLLWYTSASGGTGSATAPTPSTPTAGSTTYYVSQTAGSCESPRAAITVNINPTPAAPVVISPIDYCQNVIATQLSATGTNLLWYANAVGGAGSIAASTPSTITPGSTIFYVSQTTGGCEGPRASTTVNIIAKPPAPIVTTNIYYCQNSTAPQLSALGTNLLWYTTGTGGTGSPTAPTPSTAVIGIVIYYVTQTPGTCESGRAPIFVHTTAAPAAPTVSSPITYCQNVTAAQLSGGGTNLLWYTTSTGGTGSATAPTPSTATAGSTIFYVSQTPGTCESPRAAITVTVNATPAAPTVSSPITYCQNATAAQLSAGGTNLLWYTTSTGGTGSATAPTPSTVTSGSTIFYVSQTAGSCESPRAAITVTVNATPAAPTVSSPITYCQNATAAQLSAGGTNLIWYTTASGGTASSTAPTPSTATAGSTIYYVSQTVGSCESPRAAITVTVNAMPPAPTVSSPITYCQNATAAQLSAGGANLLWYTTASGGTGSAIAPTPSTVTSGSTIFYVSQTTGSCESPRAAITVTINSMPTAPIVSSPITYCQNATAAQLSAGGTNLLWYTTSTGGTGSATAPTPSTATAGSTTYYVSQTVGTCEGPRSIITIVIKPAPAINIGIDTVLCQGDSIHLLPTVTPNADTYTWRSITPNVPNSTISSNNTKETGVMPVDTALYVLRGTIGTCAAEDTIQVNVRWKPIIDAGQNVPICLHRSALLSGTVTHNSGIAGITYAWSPTDSLTTPNAQQTLAHPSISTWYKLTLTTDKIIYGCVFSAYDSVKVIVQPAVYAFAGNDTIAVKNSPHQLYGSGGSVYMWSSPTAVFSNPQIQNPTTTLSNDANIYLTVKDAIGCEGKDSIFIKVYDGPTYYVPNAFSPNGDGLNDIFRVIPSGISATTYLRVFNRYGLLVFETDQYLKGWDGTYNGKPAPQGTYVWIVHGTDRNKREVDMKGSVILIR